MKKPLTFNSDFRLPRLGVHKQIYLAQKKSVKIIFAENVHSEKDTKTVCDNPKKANQIDSKSL